VNIYTLVFEVEKGGNGMKPCRYSSNWEN